MTAWSNVLNYKNLSDRYVLTEQDRKGAFGRQYFEAYEARVTELKPRVLKNAEEVLGKGKFKFCSLSDAHQDEEVLIVGIIVKRIAARPSILKSLLSEDKVAYDDYEEDGDVKRYEGSSDDHIELEADKQTVRLEGSISMDECATGCCVGVLGKLGKEGVFHVNRLIWPSANAPTKTDVEGTIVFVSGLELTGDIEEDRLTISAFEFMTEWMSSHAGDDEDCPRVDRIVLIGPIVETKSSGCDVQSVVRTLTLSRNEKQSAAKSLVTVDRLIASLVDKPLINTVDVTPGVGDPCSSMWPLPPLHRVCLPRCAMSEKQVNLVTNPYEFSVDGLRVMTMSGENVTGLLRTSQKWTGSDVIENIVKWQHAAPNCPDTLDAFPVAGRDPLVMNITPHVIICGNQPHAEFRRVSIGGSPDTTCLAVCIPKFSKTRVACFLNLSDMSVKWQNFDHQF